MPFTIYNRYELEAVSKLLGGRFTLYSLRGEEESEGSIYGDTHMYDVRVRQVPATVQFEALDMVGCVYLYVCVYYCISLYHDCRLIYTHIYDAHIHYIPIRTCILIYFLLLYTYPTVATDPHPFLHLPLARSG